MEIRYLDYLSTHTFVFVALFCIYDKTVKHDMRPRQTEISSNWLTWRDPGSETVKPNTELRPPLLARATLWHHKSVKWIQSISVQIRSHHRVSFKQGRSSFIRWLLWSGAHYGCNIWKIHVRYDKNLKISILFTGKRDKNTFWWGFHLQ